MRYAPEPGWAVRDPTVIGTVASFALTSCVLQPVTASAWMAKLAFTGAVLTMLLRRFTWGRPIRFLSHRRRGTQGYGESGDDVLDLVLSSDSALLV
jgi:hypothetical protein